MDLSLPNRRQALQTLVVLSLEVFNESYYKQDALTVAKTGLAKMKAVTADI